MTTRHSPLSALKAQADKIAKMIKAAERGEKIDVQFAEARRGKETLKVGVVTDDQIITIEMTWGTISGTSEVGLAAFILKQMQGNRDAVN